MNKAVENAQELINRSVARTRTKLTYTVIEDDGSNMASIPGLPYKFKAEGDRVLVSVDAVKTGYECKECGGSGKLEITCGCENTDRPGFRYNSDQIRDARNTLPQGIADNREQMGCNECKGQYVAFRKTVDCTACNGKGKLLEIPEEAKTLPTTGVIVSVGSEVKNPEFKIGRRVLFGAYVGQLIPTKVVGIAFKVIRDYEVMCSIYGGEDLAAFDFVGIDKEM